MENCVKYEQDGCAKVIIYALDTAQEIEKVVALFEEGKAYEVSIFNLKVLPLSILIKLNAIKPTLHKISANERKLVYYLRWLGFDVVYEEQEKFASQKRGGTIKYVGLGGSAGSLPKLIEIVKALPASDFTFFVVVHQKRDHESSLAHIIQKQTEHYRVVIATQDMEVKPATIYIAPPNKQMLIVENFIFLTDDADRNYAKPSISTTFESLASTYQDQLLVMLLCGYGKDGSDSLALIRERGGMVVVEHPYECTATLMLESAINTKEFDQLLSVDGMITLLREMMVDHLDLSGHLEAFLERVYRVYHYDFRDYNREHIARRITYFCDRFGFRAFDTLADMVLGDVRYFNELFLDISVNLTTFFRNPEAFGALRQRMRRAFGDKEEIRVWCAGCSNGSEPYSVAIVLQEMGLLARTTIYATDINDVILQQAKNGAYPSKEYRVMRHHYEAMGGCRDFGAYFVCYDGFMVVDDAIKERITFLKHNLVTQRQIATFDLIVCRNVIIYFNKQLTQQVFGLFASSLVEDGLLFLGKDEVADDSVFEVVDEGNKIYKKLGGVC